MLMAFVGSLPHNIVKLFLQFEPAIVTQSMALDNKGYKCLQPNLPKVIRRVSYLETLSKKVMYKSHKKITPTSLINIKTRTELKPS